MDATFACSVFIKNEERWIELVELLRELGYTWCMGVYMAYHLGYDRRNIVVKYKSVYSNWDEPGIIDCSDDIGLFVALATLKADNKKYHLFSDGIQWFMSSTRKMKSEYIARGYYEVPIRDLQEHRKRMRSGI